MRKFGRNEPCPCGSGKKFKKCHQGREGDLFKDGIDKISAEEMGARIASLPSVSYGRSEEIVNRVNREGVAGREIRIKFVDLDSYSKLNPFETFAGQNPGPRKGGIFINPYKTVKSDPDRFYMAISMDVDDGILIHELAHVLDYLAGSRLAPGTLEPIALEEGIPVEHLEHPQEFGYWLDYLRKKFEVKLDADDSIILYLYENQLLLKGKEIELGNGLVLRSKSDKMLRFLSEHSDEVDHRIRGLAGYIGKRVLKEQANV